MSFKEMIDKFGNSYFSYNFEDSPYNIDTSQIIEDRNTFDHSMPVRIRATGLFSTDLTRRDDVLLAVLSLILLLIIEGIVNTVLLRTRNGRVNNFGFTVKYIIELLREYNALCVVRGRHGTGERDHTGHRKSKYRVFLLIFAVFILVVTLGLEVGVLFLTDPILKEVTNSMATFRIQQPIPPNYDGVRFHYRASLNRPCSAISLLQVEQSRTSINSCVATSLMGSSAELFTEAEGNVTMTIVSDLHDYGAEHKVTIGDTTVEYSARVYFNLDDEERRLMKRSKEETPEKEIMEIVHLQYVAFLFSIYASSTKDKNVDLARLNSILFEFVDAPGLPIDIIKLKDKVVRSESMTYTTTLTAVLPRGNAAFRVAEKAFRGSFAIILDGPDEADLFIEKGLSSARAVTWKETARVINWLSLLILLGVAFMVLVVLRFSLKPVTTAEIAGAFVKCNVRASISRSPVELDDDEERVFSVYAKQHPSRFEHRAETNRGEYTVGVPYSEM